MQTCFELLVTFLSPLPFFLVRDSADDLAGAMPSGYSCCACERVFVLCVLIVRKCIIVSVKKCEEIGSTNRESIVSVTLSEGVFVS